VSDQSLSAAISSGILRLMDSGYGSFGADWQLLYENNSTPANGRLWFVRGTPIRISVGSDYNNVSARLFDGGALYVLPTGSTLSFPTGVNVNSADLIGEMIYQSQKGASIDTRLIKGSVEKRAAKAAALAEAEEEEKK
jgi:hypothetical protein